MAHALFGRILTVKALIRVAFAALSLNSMGIAHSQSSYQASAHNDDQNNWMAAR